MLDVIRQVTAIKRCLQEGNRPLGFLIGAGCPQSIRVPSKGSTEPLIPGVLEITKLVIDELKNHPEAGKYVGNLQKELNNSGKSNPTAEDMLNLIRDLKPVCVGGEVRGFTADSLQCLDVTICQIIGEQVSKDLPNEITPYHGLAEWIGGTERSCSVEVFTTNYDLLLEQSFEACKTPYFDGFVGSHKGFFDIHAIEEEVLPIRWTRLLKLHGSVNWRSDKSGHVYRSSLPDVGSMRVIHPSHMKYQHSRRMPYLAMMDQLRNFVRKQSAVLLIAGYSFNDEHINELLVETVRNNPTAMIFGLVFGELSGYNEGVKLAKRCPQLTLLAEDAAVIGKIKKVWGPVDKDSAVVASGAIEVDATEGDDSELGGESIPKFMLGNFAVIGKFLHELSGAQFDSMEDEDE